MKSATTQRLEAMHHLLLAADTNTLGKAPYHPSISGPTTIKPQQLGIQLGDSSELYMPPNIAGFVGGDTVGFILSQRLDQVDDVVLGIDIGTNGEIVLSDKGKMYCCSTAAGPAFEGSTILHGMRGQSGAIEYLSIIDKDEKPEISIIGNSFLISPGNFLTRKLFTSVSMRESLNQLNPKIF